MQYNRKSIDDMDVIRYLDSKNIQWHARGDEVMLHCLFGDCDDNSRSHEAHLYINTLTGAYYCQKCGARGNKITLAQHFGDWERIEAEKPSQRPAKTPKKAHAAAKKYHEALSQSVREYLVGRGLSDVTIELFQLGQCHMYGFDWISIPVRGGSGEIEFLKLRRMPNDEGNPTKYRTWSPDDSDEGSALYGGNIIHSKKYEEVMIVEGEFDAMMAYQNELLPTVTSTAGASTFKPEWLRYFEHVRTVWLCLDNDDVGRKGAEHIKEMLQEFNPNISIMQINLPDGVKDLTDYFLARYSTGDLYGRYAEHVAGDKPINVAELSEMTIGNLADTLDLTIKYDEANKCILFLAMLTAYTEQDQLNVYITGPSSSGKTHLMQEVATYFPKEDVELIASASPTAFKHREPETDPKTGEKFVDLERRMLLFQDQPHFMLQETLRPLMSHDQKETTYHTTDRGKTSGLQDKKSKIRGFSVFVMCSANNNLDEQESTRALLLSPEVSDAKIAAGKEMANRKAANPRQYERFLGLSIDRRELMDRIRYVKKLHVDSVIVPNPQRTLMRFEEIVGKPLPRHQRDIVHLNSLIKAVALLNAHLRIDADKNIMANESDVDAAIKLWCSISSSMLLGVPPYVEHFYKSYVIPAYKECGRVEGVTLKQINTKYYELHGSMPKGTYIQKDIMPALSAAGVTDELKNPNDKKQKLIKPLLGIEGVSEEGEVKDEDWIDLNDIPWS